MSAVNARAVLEHWVRPGCTVALADGVGTPVGLYEDLVEVARGVSGVRLILGWWPLAEPPLDLDVFADVRAFMPGHGLQKAVAAGTAHYVPAYLSQVPGLLVDVWRPDVLLASVRETSRGLSLGSEASWIQAAARAATVCVAEVNNGLPDATRGPGLCLEGKMVVVAGESGRPPASVPGRGTDPVSERIGAWLATLAKPGRAVQFGPGAIGEAFVAALEVPVRIESGIITDSVVTLAERSLLIGDPLGTYLAGTPKLYDWADGRGVLDRVEVTHDPSRLAGLDLLAVNSALAIDELGQVGLDDPAAGRIAGIGGHADYASAASRSAHGLSVVAVPSRRRPADRLSIPVSTPRSVVDVVATEHGIADLRGLTDNERAAAVRSVFR